MNGKTLRKSFLCLGLAAVLISSSPRGAYATLPTFDVVNATLSEIRNSLMQSQFAQEIVIAMDHLNELRAQTLEILRFHSGLDEILNALIGDPAARLSSEATTLWDAFQGRGLITPDIHILDGRGNPAEIQSSLESMSGLVPDTDAKAHLVFEDMQVVDAFHLANVIRAAGEVTRDSARLLEEESRTASPKGAARLQAQGTSQLLVLAQQNQEATAKLLELEATQIERASREEKRLERERAAFLDDARDYSEQVSAVYKGGI